MWNVQVIIIEEGKDGRQEIVIWNNWLEIKYTYNTNKQLFYKNNCWVLKHNLKWVLK